MIDVELQRGSVAELHARDPFAGVTDAATIEPVVWRCEPTDAAIVLGSRQSPQQIDMHAADRAGLNVVRRRSGGGAVIVRPGGVIWIDVVLPHGIAPDDVRGAMVWIGERWRSAVAAQLDLARAADHRLTVHRGGMRHSAWSELVCFAGIGPGEVLLDGRKLVGLSQRRTRNGLRIQGMVHRAPIASHYDGLLRGDLPALDLDQPAWVPGLPGAALAEALAGEIG